MLDLACGPGRVVAFPDGLAPARPVRRLVPVQASASWDEPDWPIEEIVGFLKSMSTCSEHALGADFVTFEADLRPALMNESSAPVFREAWHCGYTLRRKPRS